MADRRTRIDLDIAALLGGRKVLGGTAAPARIQEAIRHGLPYRALEALARLLELSQGEITEVVGLAPRTLARRKRERQLSPAESDRVFRVARIAQLAAATLLDMGKARSWLGRPNRALGGQVPLRMLDTEVGTRQVEEVLLHINHGIYA